RAGEALGLDGAEVDAVGVADRHLAVDAALVRPLAVAGGQPVDEAPAVGHRGGGVRVADPAEVAPRPAVGDVVVALGDLQGGPARQPRRVRSADEHDPGAPLREHLRRRAHVLDGALGQRVAGQRPAVGAPRARRPVVADELDDDDGRLQRQVVAHLRQGVAGGGARHRAGDHLGVGVPAERLDEGPRRLGRQRVAVEDDQPAVAGRVPQHGGPRDDHGRGGQPRGDDEGPPAAGAGGRRGGAVVGRVRCAVGHVGSPPARRRTGNERVPAWQTPRAMPLDVPARAFALPEGVDPGALVSFLGERFDLAVDPPERTDHTVLDTADRRLRAAGAELRLNTHRGEPTMALAGRPGAPPLTATVRRRPRWLAGDLPEGPLRDRIAPAIGVRALLPLARVRGEARPARVLNRDDKTVVRLRLATHAAVVEGGEVPLTPRLEVAGVLGYRRPFERLVSVLTTEAGLVEAPGSVADEAIAAAGGDP